MYHLPIDWRRAKFYCSHPAALPEMIDQTPVIGSLAYFLPIDQIVDVIMIRDWLYQSALLRRCHLFGCYDTIFRGIMFVFDYLDDLRRFQRYLLRPSSMTEKGHHTPGGESPGDA